MIDTYEVSIMELRHLRYFVAVAEELHFGRAAQRLHMAQPPLSQQIRQLENEMGVKLFERNNRRVELTPAGDVFLRETRAILGNIENAVVRTQQTSLGEWGWFGVGFVGSVTYGVLPIILRQFRESYPNVELVLLELRGKEQTEALGAKRIHVSFTRVPTLQDGIIIEPLMQEPLMVALSSNHRLASQPQVNLRELANEPFILFRQGSQSSYGNYLISICQQAGFTPREVQNTGEMQTAISLVSAGIGVTIVPASAGNLHREGVVYRSFTEPTPCIGLSVSYRENELSPILPHFLKIAREIVRY